MNELPEDRRIITGNAQRETFDHARGSMRPEGPYRRTRPHSVLWVMLAIAILFTLALIGLT